MNIHKSNPVTSILLTVALLLTSCQPDEFSLGELVSPDNLVFTVTQNPDDPNMVILQSLTPRMTPLWQHPLGRSTRVTDTVKLAFPGEYQFTYGVQSPGGFVQATPVTVSITTFNATYIDDPLWTLLSGGVDNEKVWILDIDASGASKYFKAPLYFAGSDWGWGNECAVEGGNCWTWFPEYKGNEWMAAPGDYGTMTFNLKGGPFITVDQKMTSSSRITSGTYFLDQDAKTINFTDAIPLNNGWDQVYSSARIISLTEDAMQLAFRHPTKDEFEIFNYISKDYADNWVPSGPQPDPNFDHGNQQELLSVTTAKTWKFDLEVPYNWTDLDGAFLNDWNSRADIVATGWAPYGDADVANIDNVSITFAADGTITLVQDDGSSSTGTYTLDEATNLITFSGVTPNIPIAGWVSATTTDENKWKIVVVERDTLTNEVTGIWLGKRDPVKSEYMVFHFVLR